MSGRLKVEKNGLFAPVIVELEISMYIFGLYVAGYAKVDAIMQKLLAFSFEGDATILINNIKSGIKRALTGSAEGGGFIGDAIVSWAQALCIWRWEVWAIAKG